MYTCTLLILSFILVASALQIDDPIVFARTRELAERSRVVYRSSVSDTSLKRDPLLSMNGTGCVLRIGQLTESVGPSSTYAVLQMNAWKLWMARNPFLIIRGQVCAVELFVYDDGSFPPDPADTVVALTEWMITHDKAHIVSTGIQGLNSAMEDTANALGVPCINTGDYTAGFKPWTPWSLYLLPNLLDVAVPCVTALMNAGAKTFVEFSDPAGFLQNLYVPTVKAMGGQILASFNVTPEMRFGGPDRYQPIIDGLLKLGPFDVLMGSTTEGVNAEGTNVDFMQALHQNGIAPKGLIIWNVADYPGYRANGTWQVAGQLIGEAYQPCINQSDPVWGDSLQYDADYRAEFGISSGTNDAALAGAITMIVVALNGSNVDISQPAALMAALSAVNTSSIFGPLFFVNNTVQRTMYCFQSTLPNATDIIAVWPNTSSSCVPIIYPAYPAYPPGWLDQYKKKADETWVWAVAGTFIGLGVVLVVGAIVVFVLWKKYHVLWIPKNEHNEEWGRAEGV